MESADEANGHFPREARGGAATPAEQPVLVGCGLGTRGWHPQSCPHHHHPALHWLTAGGHSPSKGRMRPGPRDAGWGGGISRAGSPVPHCPAVGDAALPRAELTAPPRSTPPAVRAVPASSTQAAIPGATQGLRRPRPGVRRAAAGLASLQLRWCESPLKANRAQAVTALSGTAAARTQQLCWLLPASFPRPGNGAGLKAPQRDIPQPQLWTLYAAAEVLQPTTGSQQHATGRALPTSPNPGDCLSLGERTASQGCSAPCQAEPQTCAALPKIALLTGQLRLSREGTRPTSYQGMSPTDVWHHPLFMLLSGAVLKRLSNPHAGCRAGQSWRAVGSACPWAPLPPIKCRRSCLPHRGAPFIIRCKVLQDPQIKGAITASSLIIIDYPFQARSQTKPASPERGGAEGGPSNRLAIFTADDPSQGAISVHPSRKIQA